MFDNTEGRVSDLPVEIQEFYYEEVREEPTGEFIEEIYEYEDGFGNIHEGIRSVPVYESVPYTVKNAEGDRQENVATVLLRGGSEELVNKFLGFTNNNIAWIFHDSYIAWLEGKPEPEDEKYSLVGEEDVPLHSFDEDYVLFVSQTPIRPADKVLEDYVEYSYWAKLQGVEFEGVMCSATKEDMWGLNSVQAWVSAGNATKFKFDNGNYLVLDANNYEAFQAVWVPFRQSFFE